MLQPWEEIIEAQKIRSDLLKWKVVAIAVLGATGLGLSGKNLPFTDLVLCAIPFVAAYIDMLCRHLSLRIMVISQFWMKYVAPTTRHPKNELSAQLRFLREHEIFVRQAAKENIFILEDRVVVISSAIFAIILLILPSQIDLPHARAVFWIGIIGLVLTGVIEGAYQVLRKRASELEKRV